MSLAADLSSIRDRATGELIAARDYHWLSQYVWRYIEESFSKNALEISNKGTGTRITATELVERARVYGAVQTAESAFQQYISIFECFFLDVVTRWLEAHPASLGRKTVDFQMLLDLRDMDLVIKAVIQRRVNEILYERPTAWFEYLNELARLGCPGVMI